ncbi:hypothetical protein SAMN04515671_1095 [Nakamurella panacisegetis]|uniref:Uncharacterized protein n=1 Tax=Nakamurella panacisegetis TaxID=1090615 RepID=A0A1H0JYG3_9ACTN|nr:hypothetical protein SAMN04515671_1095 [Nakamurella panacisegetis]
MTEPEAPERGPLPVYMMLGEDVFCRACST